MAGYTSRILLTFTIPFFGFVFWFLKKKKYSKSVSSTGIQVEDSTSPALFEKHTFEFDVDSTLYKNREKSCEDNVAMQLKETQTVESQNTGVSQQNGVTQNTVQQNGLSQDCVLQNNMLHDCVQQNGLSHDCAQRQNDTQDALLNDISQTNVQHNGASDTLTSPKDSEKSNILGSSTPEKSVSSNCVQHNGGVSQKSVLQNGMQQNGTSKGKKKKSKGREKSNTCPTDIANSNERLHLEDEIQLVQQFEVIDINVPTKNGLLNAISENEMDKTNCASQSSSCVNGDTNLEIELSNLTNGESAKECSTDMHATDERNSKETQPLQTEISADPCTSLILPVDCANAIQINGDMMGSPVASYCDSLVSIYPSSFI